MTPLSEHPAFHGLVGQRTLPPLSRLAFGVALTVLAWETRRRTRAHLRQLDDHLMRDIGLQPHAAAQECDKPFWRD
jgi:uncharacterized protein YjiS (DUF1127 family)